MFTDNPNIEVVTEGIYLYRGFLEKDFVDKVSESLLEKAKLVNSDEHNHPNNWYADKTYELEDLAYSYKKVSELLLPELYVVPSIAMLITQTGDEMFVHTDSPEHEEDVDSPDHFETCHIVDYGVVMYYGEWTGGDVFYPKLGLSVSPKAGDLLIHKSRHPYDHGVKPIESGVRGAQSLFAVTAENDPGTFILYGSEEFRKIEESDNPLGWIKPIKYQN